MAHPSSGHFTLLRTSPFQLAVAAGETGERVGPSRPIRAIFAVALEERQQIRLAWRECEEEAGSGVGVIERWE